MTPVWQQRKVEIGLMCLFDEKLSKLKKVCDGGPKSALNYCPVMLNQAKIEPKPIL